jgi:hypothetical protein
MNKPMLVGRTLKSLTPAELEEIVRLIKPDMLDALDECEDDEEPSMHSKYKFVHKAEDDEGEEMITFWEWTTGMTDCGEEADTWAWSILAGEVSGPMGDSCAVLPIVKWFLDHGWRWADQPEQTAPNSGVDAEVPYALGLCHRLRDGAARMTKQEFRNCLKRSIGADKDYADGCRRHFQDNPAAYLASRTPQVQSEELLRKMFEICREEVK